MVNTRKPWVGGNWKCNGTKASVETLVEMLSGQAKQLTDKVDVVCFPSPVHMTLVASKLPASMVGNQNISKTGNGAYTGETSVEMLKDLGIECTLVGHSERRTRYGDTDDVVAAKVEMCQQANVISIICIGETLAEREANETLNVLKRQMDAVIPKITDWSKVVIAYEPVWAIGTGKVATTEQAQECHLSLRDVLKVKVSQMVSDTTRIVYGGSVTETTSSDLINQPDVDGFLVGGASLKPAFIEIVKSVHKH